MAGELYIYSTPKEADVSLTLDTGVVLAGTACSANGRDDAHLIQLPAGTTGQGGLLRVTCDGYWSIEHRGLVCPSDTGPATFMLDDVHLTEQSGVAPPVPPAGKPDPNADPFAIIKAVYEQGDYDLSTKEGCGTYTEAACMAIHGQHSLGWGHISKFEGQNQWNGHAVDAIMLLKSTPNTNAGIYDIILSTESPEAEPAWSYKGPPDSELWYYPA